MRKGDTTARSSTQQQQTVNADHHIHGHMALTPIMLIMLIVVCGAAFWFFSQLQITATEQTVFNLLQTGIQLTPGMTASQVQQFINGNLDTHHTIAAGIGWAVQIALLLLSFPADSALLTLHRRHNIDVSTSLTRSAMNYAKWQSYCMRALIGGDIVTDFVYVMQGHVTVTWDGWWPNIAGLTGGVFIVGLVYPIAVCFVTVFVGRYLFVFIDALLERVRQAA